MKLYVALTTCKNKELLKPLEDNCKVVLNSTGHRPTKSELKELVKEYNGIIIGRLEIIDKDVLKESKLKFIGVLAKGLNNIDLEEVKKKNIALFHTPDANISSVAEHTMALILALSKNLIRLDRSVREGKFNSLRHSTFDVKDKVLGIVGAGPVAREVVRRAVSFEMKVICYTPHPQKHKDFDVDFVPLETLLKDSDFVSLHIPLSEETENTINESEFELMKPTAFLVNTSRGKIVNEDALVEALKNHKIAGAGVDVFREEPMPNKELFKLDNVILTPHVAGVSKESIERMEAHLVEDIISFLENKQPKYRVV